MQCVGFSIRCWPVKSLANKAVGKQGVMNAIYSDPVAHVTVPIDPTCKDTLLKILTVTGHTR